MERARWREARTVTGWLIGLALVATACTGSSTDSSATPDAGAELPDEAANGSSGDAFTPADDADLGPIDAQPAEVEVSDSVLEPIEPVPDTGVPGIDSDDDFCRSWSEFAGSYQALTFAWAFQNGVDAARLEVVASDVMVTAVESLAVALPGELEPERTALTVDLPGPILRRAERALEILAINGEDEASVELLGELWLAAVTEQGLETEALAVVIDDDQLDDAVEASASTLVEELPPITEDPSLIVDVQIPLTETYLFDNCPDRGILAGNDNVDL